MYQQGFSGEKEKMKEYKLVCRKTYRELRDAVISYIGLGWTYQGTAFIKGGLFCQAIVKD